jgi:hypothetical protein
MPEGKSRNDFKMEARAAWRRFLHCVGVGQAEGRMRMK